MGGEVHLDPADTEDGFLFDVKGRSVEDPETLSTLLEIRAQVGLV